MSTDTRLRFNKKALESVPLPQPGSRFTFHDLEVPGLQLRVTDRGIKSFCVFRRSKRGVPERITIGRFQQSPLGSCWTASDSRSCAQRTKLSGFTRRALC